jgi:hypothetical protein
MVSNGGMYYDQKGSRFMNDQAWKQPVEVSLSEMRRKAVPRGDKRFPFYEDVVKRLERTDSKKFAVRYQFKDKKTAQYYRTFLNTTSKALLGSKAIATRIVEDGDRVMFYVTRGENWNGRVNKL